MRINNKTEKQQFLELNISDDGSYALVTYDNHTEPIWITRYNNWGEDGHTCFLEAPCQLMKFDFQDDSDMAVKQFVKSLYGNDNLENDINYVRSMIRDGYLYEIENFQTAPFLPSQLDDLTLISEQYCLEWILNHKKEDK